jgi:hypothetical protein
MKEHAKVVDQLAVALELNEMYQSTWMREYELNFFSIRVSRNIPSMSV